MNVEPEFLGIPKNETEWLCYNGTCVVFVGLEKVYEDYDSDYPDYEPEFVELSLESEEETKRRLIAGIQTVGVRCEEIKFKWTDKYNGLRCCECVCYYNKPYQVYKSEFFIDAEGLIAFEDCQVGSFEFSFDRRL